jgi:hypothetical protein
MTPGILCLVGGTMVRRWYGFSEAARRSQPMLKIT